ncbi:MAG: geranylgeranyl reductase family protein [Candidatus Micrarchaeota archaeon]
MTEFDVIVVGGGPGGSTATSFLAKAGKKVLLLEKASFPRDKTCGDAISGKSLAVLKELGLEHIVEESPHGTVSGVLFSSPKGSSVIIPFGQETSSIRQGYCCRRLVYDNILFENTRKTSAVIKENFIVSSVIQENGFVVGVRGTNQEKQEEEFRAKLVIGADGFNSIVAAGTNSNSLPEDHWCVACRAYYKGVKGNGSNIELHFINEVLPGYFWIFPMENGIANVGVGMIKTDMIKNKVNLKQVMLDAIKNNELFKERFSEAFIVDPSTGQKLDSNAVKGWNLSFGSFHRKAYGNGFMLVGDAASLVDPFTGEGIGNAMLSGKIAAKTAINALSEGNYSEEFLKSYDTELWSLIAGELDTSYKLQRLGKHTFLVNLIIAKAARNKELREVLAGMMVNEEAKKSFLSPMFYVRFLLSRPWLP